MSREIKFRAWDANKGRFIIEPEHVHVALTGNVSHCSDSGISDRNDLVLQRYTGLKDQRGVEIYEGDVVARVYRQRKPDGMYYSSERIAMSNSKIVEFTHTTKMLGFNIVTGHSLVVIGNIHENPELLEGNTNASI